MSTVGQRKVGLAWVQPNEQAKENVAKCMETGMLGRGEFIERFEELVADYCGAHYGIATCNGTMADVILLSAMKQLYGYTRAAMPVLTFAAQLNSVLMAKMAPQFVDIGYDLQARIEPGEHLRYPANLLGGVNPTTGSDVVCDSCETFARGIARDRWATTVSFYATHCIGIGEGGMILTDDKSIAERCRSLRDHGQIDGDIVAKFTFEHNGYNGRMSNLAAAVGVGMMADADAIVGKRWQVAEWYDEQLQGDWCSRLVSPHGYPVEIEHAEYQKLVIRKLYAAGIESRRVFSVLTMEKAFRQLHRPGTRYPVAETIASNWIYLPCHQGMTQEDVAYVCEVLRDCTPGN